MHVNVRCELTWDIQYIFAAWTCPPSKYMNISKQDTIQRYSIYQSKRYFTLKKKKLSPTNQPTCTIWRCALSVLQSLFSFGLSMLIFFFFFFQWKVWRAVSKFGNMPIIPEAEFYDCLIIYCVIKWSLGVKSKPC